MCKKTNLLVSLISVVDDDQSVREATTSLLKSNGFRAEVFSSAEDFLASRYLNETKCLVLDVQMPGIAVSLMTVAATVGPASPGTAMISILTPTIWPNSSKPWI